MTGYRSIFWSRNWVHTKYYGWQVSYDEPHFKVLTKAVGPFRRALVLTSQPNAQLETKLRATRLLDWRTMVVLHDFNDMGSPRRLIGGRTWMRTSDSERLLNKATFVVDLTQGRDELWQAFGAKSRNAVRKAESSGSIIRLSDDPESAQKAFFALYEPIVAERGLRLPRADLLARMSRNGDLLCFTSTNSAGDTQAVNLVYVCERQAIYLFGAGGKRVDGGVGQQLQWETILFLKSKDFLWYDLGGLPSLDPSNGIYRFKKSTGGELVLLGSEYLNTPLAIRVLYSLKKLNAGFHRNRMKMGEH